MGIDLTKQEILSQRLLLRPVDLGKAEAIFAAFTADITRFMFPKPAAAIAETRAFIQESIGELRDGSNFQLVILAQTSQEFLGCIGLHELGQPDPEIGLWLKAAAHGQGYGFEACAALVDWAKAHLDFSHIRYPVDRRNLASRGIAEKLGGVIKREFKSINLSGYELDQVEYWIAK